MKQPEQTKEEKTVEEIFNEAYLNYQRGVEPFKKYVLEAMEEYASQKCKALQDDLTREQERINQMEKDWREINHKYNAKLQRIQVLEEALRVVLKEDYDHLQKNRVSALKASTSEMIKQALTGSQSKD